MADKSISELVAVTSIQAADLFVCEQNGTAKKVSGQVFENWLTSFADGHGGIQTITYTAPVSPSLVGSMLITMADTTTVTVPVNNGRSITGIAWATSGTAGNGQTHTGTISYNDGTTSTVTFKDGVKGDQGNTWYVYIRYASQQPTSSSQMSTTPDNWMGIYCGTATTAPVSYNDYTWFKIKGEQGDNGVPAVLNNSVIEYATSSVGTEPPASGWSLTIPTVSSGNYLWTRVTNSFNTGNDVVYYAVSRNGVDGQGAVSSVLGLSPDANGNIAFDATDVLCSDGTTTVDAKLTSLDTTIASKDTTITNNKPKHFSTTLNSLPATITDSSITSDMRVFNAYLAKPYAISGDLMFTTSNGSVVFSGTLSESTAFEFDLMKVR